MSIVSKTHVIKQNTEANNLFEANKIKNNIIPQTSNCNPRLLKISKKKKLKFVRLKKQETINKNKSILVALNAIFLLIGKIFFIFRFSKSWGYYVFSLSIYNVCS